MSWLNDMKYTTSFIPISDDVNKTLKTYPECLRYYAEKRPHKEAYVFVCPNGDRQTITWSELYSKSSNMAKSLIKLGVKLGNVVCVCMKICPEYVYAVFGIMLAGGICCSVPSSLLEQSGTQLVEYMQELKTCVALVIDPGMSKDANDTTETLIKDLGSPIETTQERLKFLKFLVLPRKHKEVSVDCVAFVNEIIEPRYTDMELPDVNEGDIAYLLGSKNNADTKTLCGQTHGFNGKIFFYHSERPYFVYGDGLFTLQYGFPHNVRGGLKVVTLFETGEQVTDKIAHIIDVILQEKCLTMTVPLSITKELISRQMEIPDDWPVKIFMSDGRINDAWHREIFNRIAPFLECIYVTTKLGAITYQTLSATSYEEFHVGKLREGFELKIVDTNGEIIPLGKQGELFLRSIRPFPLYYINKERNRQIVRAGWLRTGDVAMMKEDGDLYVYGKIEQQNL